MYLKAIMIKNFRGIEQIELTDLSPTLLLLGNIGQGKTSFLHAIQYAMFGRCADGDGKRILTGRLIGDYGDQADIKLTLAGLPDGPARITLSLKAGGKLSARYTYGEAKAWKAGQRAAFFDAIGVPIKHAEVKTNPGMYLMGPELGEVLADLAGETRGMQKEVQAFCGKMFPEIEKYAAKTGISPYDTENLGQRAYEDRTDLKKEIARIKTELSMLSGGSGERPPLPLNREGNSLPTSARPMVQENIEKLQKEIGLLHEELGRAKEARTMGARFTTEEKTTDPKLKLRLKENDVENDKAALDSAREAKQQADAVLSVAHNAMSTVNGEMVALRAEAKKAQHAIDEVRAVNEKDKCERCGAKWTMARIKTEMAPRLIAVNKAQDAVNDLTAEMEGPLQQAIDTAKDGQVAAHAAWEAANSKVGESNRLLAAFRDRTALASARAPGSVELDIEKLQKRIRLGEQMLTCWDAVELWDKAKTGTSQQVAEKEQIRTRFLVTLEHLEWIIRIFHDGEFRKSLIQGSLGPFLERANKFLEPHHRGLQIGVDGKVVSLNMENWSKTGKASDQNIMFPIPECSKGERKLAEVAVATAFDFPGIVCLDDLESLQARRSAVVRTLSRQTDGIVLAAGWSMSDSPDLNALRHAFDPMDVFWFENGQIVETDKQ